MKQKKIIILASLLIIMIGIVTVVWSINDRFSTPLTPLANDTNEEAMVTSVTIPSQLYGLVTVKGFNADVMYNASPDMKIEIVLNKEISDMTDYRFYFLQGGRYIPIVHPDLNQSDRYYFYYIKGKTITIEGPNGTLPTGFVWLGLPDEIKLTDHSSVSMSVHQLLLSPNFINPHQQLTWINDVSADREPTLVLPKLKNDGNKIVYINKNHVPFYKDAKGNDHYFKLMRGESGQLLGEEGNFVRIAIYTRKSESLPEKIAQTNDFLSGNYIHQLVGYISKEDITILPEPMNDDTIYAVVRSHDLNSHEGDPDAHLIVSLPLIGKNEVFFPVELEPLKREHFQSLESVTLWQWLDMLPGNNYWTTYLDNNGRVISKLDPKAHEPEYHWNEKEYGEYKAARKEYISYVLERIKAFEVASEYLNYKQKIEEAFRNAELLQDIWIEWGYQSGQKRLPHLDQDWFFQRVFDEQNLLRSEKEKYQTQLLGENRSNPDQDLDNKLSILINELIYNKEITEVINKSYEQFIVQ